MNDWANYDQKQVKRLFERKMAHNNKAIYTNKKMWTCISFISYCKIFFIYLHNYYVCSFTLFLLIKLVSGRRLGRPINYSSYPPCDTFRRRHFRISTWSSEATANHLNYAKAPSWAFNYCCFAKRPFTAEAQVSATCWQSSRWRHCITSNFHLYLHHNINIIPSEGLVYSAPIVRSLNINHLAAASSASRFLHVIIMNTAPKKLRHTSLAQNNRYVHASHCDTSISPTVVR